jgi:hypothetical protein
LPFDQHLEDVLESFPKFGDLPKIGYMLYWFEKLEVDQERHQEENDIEIQEKKI